MSCSKRIIKYLEACNCWVSGDMIEKKAQEAGFKGSTGARCARKLAENGKIERREDRKGYVWYAPKNTAKPKEYKIIYKPTLIDGKMVAIPHKIEL